MGGAALASTLGNLVITAQRTKESRCGYGVPTDTKHSTTNPFSNHAIEPRWGIGVSQTPDAAVFFHTVVLLDLLLNALTPVMPGP